VTLLAITAVAGCDKRVVSPSPVAATPVTFPAATIPTPSIPGVLTFSSFVITPIQWGIKADFTLTETAGQGVTLESLTLEESAGRKDFVDAWCFGDELITIQSHTTLDGKTLGYCQPRIQTQTPGEYASLTAVYKQADGRRDTARALIRVPHDVSYGP